VAGEFTLPCCRQEKEKTCTTGSPLFLQFLTRASTPFGRTPLFQTPSYLSLLITPGARTRATTATQVHHLVLHPEATSLGRRNGVFSRRSIHDRPQVRLGRERRCPGVRETRDPGAAQACKRREKPPPGTLAQDPHLPCHARQDFRRPIQHFPRVRGSHDGSNSRFALRDGRESDAGGQ